MRCSSAARSHARITDEVGVWRSAEADSQDSRVLPSRRTPPGGGTSEPPGRDYSDPNSEIENGRDAAFRAAHASGVWFSASRRKHRSTTFFPSAIPEIGCDKCSGVTPLTRGTQRDACAPILVSEFGFRGRSFSMGDRMARQSPRRPQRGATAAALRRPATTSV